MDAVTELENAAMKKWIDCVALELAEVVKALELNTVEANAVAKTILNNLITEAANVDACIRHQNN